MYEMELYVIGIHYKQVDEIPILWLESTYQAEVFPAVTWIIHLLYVNYISFKL